jgi:Uma2 family endonuclease
MPDRALEHVIPGAALTLESWAELPEDAEGELVDGVLVEDELTDFVHDAVVAFFIAYLRDWARPRGGLVAASDVKYAVTESRGRKADVSLYLPGAPRPPGRGPVDVPPSIIVEVVSPRPRDARRDRVEKFDEYATFGVHYYWIVDPQLRSLEIYERAADGRYARTTSATSGRIDAIPACPGLSLDLDALWQEVDELETTARDGT